MSDDTVHRILDFLKGIGIAVEAEPADDDWLLPGLTVRSGVLIYDPDRLPWPGDLLHEAGHIAVTDPAVRNTRQSVPDDPAEEMAAIAWSYAAALAADVDPAQVFHTGGYKGGGEAILGSFRAAHGGGVGVPMLQYYGMSGEPHRAEELGLPAFPQMVRWLR